MSCNKFYFNFYLDIAYKNVKIKFNLCEGFALNLHFVFLLFVCVFLLLSFYFIRFIFFFFYSISPYSFSKSLNPLTSEGVNLQECQINTVIHASTKASSVSLDRILFPLRWKICVLFHFWASETHTNNLWHGCTIDFTFPRLKLKRRWDCAWILKPVCNPDSVKLTLVSLCKLRDYSLNTIFLLLSTEPRAICMLTALW